MTTFKQSKPAQPREIRWGEFSRIEFFDARFHHGDCREPLWCVRRTGTGFANPYPMGELDVVPPPFEDECEYDF